MRHLLLSVSTVIAGAALLTACIETRAPSSEGEVEENKKEEPKSGGPPLLTATPPNADFGARVNGTTQSQTFLIVNEGEESTGALTATPLFDNAPNYAIDISACPAILGGASCNVLVTFAPTGGLTTQRFTLSGAAGGSVNIDVSGSGLAPGGLSADKTTIVFEDTEVGDTSEAVAWTITNTGEAPTGALTLTNTDTTSFETDVAGCPPLGSGESCIVAVTFTPATAGEKTATLTLSNAALTATLSPLRGTAFRESAGESIAAGSEQTCAVLEDGSVKCWGLNTSGQLGIDDTASRGDVEAELGDDLPSVIGLGRPAVAVAVGVNFACAVLDDRRAKCWGANNFGQLGQGDTVGRGGNEGDMAALQEINFGARRIQEIDAGSGFACALFEDGGVGCWGGNSLGQLGIDSTERRGDDASELSAGLIKAHTGAGRTVTSIDVGTSHTCAVLDDGEVKCWGLNQQGQLGTTANSSPGTTGRGDATGEMDLIPLVPLDEPAASVACGFGHTCALLESGDVKCWGSNLFGQLGQGDINNVATDDAIAELDPIDFGDERRAVAIAAANNASCALLDDGGVKCWGEGFQGETGQGATDLIGDTPDELANTLPIALGTGVAVTRLSMGTFYVCALFETGGVKCWGRNRNGQLGLGDTENRGDAPDEMGDDLPFVSLGTVRE